MLKDEPVADIEWLVKMEGWEVK